MRRAVMGLVGCGMWLGGVGLAECAAPLTTYQSRGAAVGVSFDASVSPAVVREAIDLWQGCANFGLGFPAVVEGGQGMRTVHVKLLPHGNGGYKCGTFRGSEIRLYGFYTDRNGRTRSCGSVAQNLAHELGHALGLDDAPSGATCQSTIMAPLTANNERRRRPSDAECSLVGQKWITPSEERTLARFGGTEPYEFAEARIGSSGTAVDGRGRR
jgi:hypothetical protein